MSSRPRSWNPEAPVLCLPLQRGGLPYLTPQQLGEVTEGNLQQIAFSVSVFDALHTYEALASTETQKGDDEVESALLRFWDLAGTEQVELGTPGLNSLPGIEKETTNKSGDGKKVERSAPLLVLTCHGGGPNFGLPVTDSSLTGMTDGGRFQLDPATWIKAVKKIKPDLAVDLHQGLCVEEGPAAKVRRTNCLRNEQWHAGCGKLANPSPAAGKNSDGVEEKDKEKKSDATEKGTASGKKKKVKKNSTEETDYVEIDFPTQTQIMTTVGGIVLGEYDEWPYVPPKKEEKLEGEVEKETEKDAVPPAGKKRAREEIVLIAGSSSAQSDLAEVLKDEEEKYYSKDWVFASSANEGEDLRRRLEYLLKMSCGTKEKSLSLKVMVEATTYEETLIALLGGASMVDCRAPFSYAARGLALVIDRSKLKNRLLALSEGNSPSINHLELAKSLLMEEPAHEVINLWDLKYETDLNKLRCESERSSSSTCDRHTKSYIHHLLMLQELNGSTLLALHNLGEFLALFNIFKEVCKKK